MRTTNGIHWIQSNGFAPLLLAATSIILYCNTAPGVSLQEGAQVLFLLNLFAIVVLDEFNAQNPVSQTIGPSDLWAFTKAWADETVGCGACPSLSEQNILERLMNKKQKKKLMDDCDEDLDVEELDASDRLHLHPDSIETKQMPVNQETGKKLKGHHVIAQKKKRNNSRPEGVIHVVLKRADDLDLILGDNWKKTNKVRPLVEVFTKPRGVAHPFTTMKYDCPKNCDINLDDGTPGGTDCQMFLDRRERNLTFRLMGKGGKVLGQAHILSSEIIKCVETTVKELPLFGDLKPIEQATQADLALQDLWRRLPSGEESPRWTPRGSVQGTPRTPGSGALTPRKGGDPVFGKDPLSPRSPSSPRSPQSSRTPTVDLSHYRPKVGTLTVEVKFTEGLALPRFDFMSQYHDNTPYKERGCGIEGWLWKRSLDAFARWERRWFWISAGENGEPPGLYYYRKIESELQLEQVGRTGKLGTESDGHEMIGILQEEISEVTSNLVWDDGKKHKVRRGEDELAECEFQFMRSEHSNSDGKERKTSAYRFRVQQPDQKLAWMAGLEWLQGGCEGKRPRPVSHPFLNERDLERAKNNPALIPLPFCRIRHLLSGLSGFDPNQSLVDPNMSREELLFICYNLEMHAHTRGKPLHKNDVTKVHVGEYLSDLYGLDYTMTLRRVALLYYGRQNSL